MTKIDDGGPVFPRQEVPSMWTPEGHRLIEGVEGVPGISLRDYFAIHAEIESIFESVSVAWGEILLGRPCPTGRDPKAAVLWLAEFRAVLRYIEADAMLKARKT